MLAAKILNKMKNHISNSYFFPKLLAINGVGALSQTHPAEYNQK